MKIGKAEMSNGYLRLCINDVNDTTYIVRFKDGIVHSYRAIAMNQDWALDVDIEYIKSKTDELVKQGASMVRLLDTEF